MNRLPSDESNVAEGNVALGYEVAPTKAFGFGRSKLFSQTRWRF